MSGVLVAAEYNALREEHIRSLKRMNPDTIALIKQVSYVLGGFSAGMGILGLLVLWFRCTSRVSPVRASRADLANMMILLQTMRDMLEEQKKLARELNKGLDQKVNFIKSTVDTALKDLDHLREQMKNLSERISHAQTHSMPSLAVKNEASTVANEKAGKDKNLSSSKMAHATDPRFVEVPQPSMATSHVGASSEMTAAKPELHVLASPRRPIDDANLLDNWVGLDFSGDDPEPQGFSIPEELPEKPDNPEQARKAFSALLDIEEEDDRKAAEKLGLNTTSGGNGREKRDMGPLQLRIYNYRDAGMTVAQIARELGIGKGEVRLILSLRKDRE